MPNVISIKSLTVFGKLSFSDAAARTLQTDHIVVWGLLELERNVEVAASQVCRSIAEHVLELQLRRQNSVVVCAACVSRLPALAEVISPTVHSLLPPLGSRPWRGV